MLRVYLSFADGDLGKVKKIIQSIFNPDYAVDFYDGIFDGQEEKAVEASKRTIGEKIVLSNITVCLIGDNTYKSRRVDVELRKSLQKGNKVIAMALENIEWAVLPEAVKQENLKFYPWDPKRLRNLIMEGGP